MTTGINSLDRDEFFSTASSVIKKHTPEQELQFEEEYPALYEDALKRREESIKKHE